MDLMVARLLGTSDSLAVGRMIEALLHLVNCANEVLWLDLLLAHPRVIGEGTNFRHGIRHGLDEAVLQTAVPSEAVLGEVDREVVHIELADHALATVTVEA